MTRSGVKSCLFSMPSWAGLVAAIALGLLSIDLGFFADDYVFRAALTRHQQGAPEFWELFQFANGDPANNALRMEQGALPWWAVPDLKIRFVRPIASLMFSLDSALFGQSAWPQHLHSLLWWGLLVVTFGRVARRLVSEPTSRLAQLIFVLSPAHVMPYAWLSARNGLVGTTLALLGWLAQLRYRQDGWKPGRFWAPALLVAGFLTFEGVLGILVFWALYELAADRGDNSWQNQRRRLLLPTGLLCGLVGVHKLLGGGVHGSGGYLDVFDPAEIVPVTERGLALAAQALVGLPVEASPVLPHYFASIVGLAAILGVSATIVGLRKHLPESERSATWLMAGGLLALAPSVGGFPSGRTLLVPNLAFAIVHAVVIRHFWQIAREKSAPSRLGLRAAGGILSVIHLAVAPLMSVLSLRATVAMARQSDRAAASAPVGDARRVFVIASDPMVGIYPSWWRVDPPNQLCWSWISGAKAKHVLRRESKTSWVVEVDDETWLTGPFEQVYRSNRYPLRIGDRIHQCGARIAVLTLRKGRPTRVRVELTRAEAHTARWLTWDGKRLTEVPEQRVGDVAHLLNYPGPMRFF